MLPPSPRLRGFERDFPVISTACAFRMRHPQVRFRLRSGDADCAIAMVDEIASGDHVRQRISVVRK